MNIDIRQAEEKDIHKIATIELLTSPDPWSENAIYHDVCENKNACVLVAEFEDEIVGYLNAWKVADEFQLCNIGVLKEYRRNHIGQQFIDVLIGIAKALKCSVVTLEVREKNLIARQLYEKNGFQTVGVRKNYYQNDSDNAILMDKEL